MKKEIRNGVVVMTSNDNEKFINMEAAQIAFEMMQRIMVFQGFLTCSTISPERRKFELTVHFEDSNYPRVPLGYIYTKKEITSHEYWDKYRKTMQRVRCVEFSFKY